MSIKNKTIESAKGAVLDMGEVYTRMKKILDESVRCNEKRRLIKKRFGKRAIK